MHGNGLFYVKAGKIVAVLEVSPRLASGN